jgi:hypothetical protein
MMFLGVLYFQYMTGVFKAFGESNGLDDAFLTFAATFAMVFNCVSRLCGGIILDRMTFKMFFGLVLTVQTAVALSYDTVARYQYVFVFYLCLTYFVMGSTFVSLPILFAKVFGPEVGS